MPGIVSIDADAQIALRESRRMRKGFTRRPKAEEPVASREENYISGLLS